MKVNAIDTFLITLPFRFAFGHSLATRAQSTNLFVRITLDNGVCGYGEGVPRDYVTGENAEKSQKFLEQEIKPLFSGLDLSNLEQVLEKLQSAFTQLGLNDQANGSAFCALELAVLDAAAKANQVAVADWLGPVINKRIRYGGVIPFGGKNATLAMLLLYKACGFATVKIKVGQDLSTDLEKVKRARQIFGPNGIIRVDANCAWTVEQTLRAAEAFKPYNVASYEQPVAADNLEGLQKLTADLPEQVLADESLCTIAQAELLAKEKICSAFNIRISKVGGLLAAKRIVEIAEKHNIYCHLGAQVGESGILSAAARTFACVNQPFENYEGSMNAILLKEDLTAENLTVKGGGYGDLTYPQQQVFGFGFSLKNGTLERQAKSLVRPAPAALANPTTNDSMTAGEKLSQTNLQVRGPNS